MSKPLSVFVLGAGPLSNALRVAGRGRSMLDCGRHGAGVDCFNLGQIRQVLEVWRGEREIPDDIRPLCATARRLRLPRGSAPFRYIDVALLEPVSPVELVFRDYSLSGAEIFKTLLGPVRALGPDEARAAGRWLRAGLLRGDEVKRAKGAAELVELLPRIKEGAEFAEAVILETRSRVVETADALRAVQTLIGRPVGVITGSPEHLAVGQTGKSGDSFQDELTFAARQLNIPVFDVSDVVSRHQFDASMVVEPNGRHYSTAFLPILVDATIQFMTEVAESASDLAPEAFDSTPSPFFKDHVFTHFEERSARSILESKGVRLLPSPFNSALAIVSDLDGSRRPQYEAYTGQLIGKFGLDFGDSTWLQWAYSKKRGEGIGFGFLSPDGATGCRDGAEIFGDTRTFFESLVEYHDGNVDHFHAFFMIGPRVVVASNSRALGGGKIAFDLDLGDVADGREFRHVSIRGVCVVTKKDKTIEIHAVRIEGADGVLTGDYKPTPYDAPLDGRQYHMFSLAGQTHDDRPIPKFDNAKSVVINLCDHADTNNIEHIIVTNTYGVIVLESLKLLEDNYHVEMNLITEHAAQHFRNPPRAAADDRKLAKQFRQSTEGFISGAGTLLDNSGDLIFSTDADHPNSMCRVFPEISSEREVRFVVPAASSGALGFSPFELVTPSPTRNGGGVYWAKRVLPKPTPSSPGGHRERTRHSTFAARLRKCLETVDGAPGLFWPIYTHLGGLDGEAVPIPYLDEGVLSSLQDRAFNISGAVPPHGRVWVTRASVIYDYALMLRSVGEHVTRPDPNSVSIRSWSDPVIGKDMPRSKGQLYGLTFYIDDPAKADVRLDGERLETVFLNPPDETGRPSVTIAECDIRHLLFENLDPTINRPGDARPIGGEWTWRPRGDGDRAFGRLAVSASGNKAGAASLTVPLRGWTAMGAQLASLAVRHHGAARFAVEFETQTGGRFCFGERSFVGGRKAEFTASYAFDPHLFVAGAWRTLAVPFHDLAWSAAARPGGPLPSHPLKSMTLHCIGDGGAAIDIAGLAFLRPRTSHVLREAAGFCLGGRLAGYSGREVVHLAGRDSGSSERREMPVDQRGFFCFDQVAPGIYEVWADADAGPAHDRRGPLIEVGGDTMILVLGPAPP